MEKQCEYFEKGIRKGSIAIYCKNLDCKRLVHINGKLFTIPLSHLTLVVGTSAMLAKTLIFVCLCV